MKIIIFTYGSRGDVQPMLALALKLKSEGHCVLLVAPPENEHFVRKFNCPFKPLGRNFMASMKKTGRTRFSRRFKDVVSFWKTAIEDQFKQVTEIAIHPKPDLIIASPLILAARSIAEAHHIPFISYVFCPQRFEAQNHLLPALKRGNRMALAGYISGKCVRLYDRLFFLNVVNEKRRKLGINPIEGNFSDMRGQRVIVASDPILAEIPAEHNCFEMLQCGYMHLKEPYQFLPELESFLGVGPPPVYIGFGSMGKFYRPKLVATLVKAVNAAGVRAVIQKFWDGINPHLTSTKDIFLIKDYPHRDLFPRMAAVVHHGGAGTTATAAISGTPQIIVPYMLDQFYWAYQINRRRLGPKPINRAFLSVSNLAAAMRTVLYDQEIKDNARKVAMQVQQRDATEMAVEMILKLTGAGTTARAA